MKKKIKYVSFAMAIMMLLSAFATVPALAKTVKKPETPAVKYIWSEMKGQIVLVATKNKNSKNNPDGYQIVCSQDKSFKSGNSYNWFPYKWSDATNFAAVSKIGLTTGKTYYAKMRAYNNDNKSKVYSDWSNTKSIKVNKLTNKELEINNKFKNQDDFRGAWICSLCGKMSGTGYNNTCYRFVSLFNEDPPKGMKYGCNHLGTRSSNVKIGKVTGFKKINTYGGLILNWNTVKYADGYQIKYSTSKSFKKSKYADANTNSNYEFGWGEVKENTKYYLKVRAFMKNGNGKKYGPWSSVINGTTKTTQPFGIKIASGKKKMTVSCKNYYKSGRQRVLVKYSTDKNFKNPKYKWMSYKKSSKTITGLKSGKTYYVKLKAYTYTYDYSKNKYVVASKSSYSKAQKVKIK